MLETILRKIAGVILPSWLRKSEHTLGYKLVFHHIPSRFVNGMVEWDMTDTFEKFGLPIKAGADYWTLGHVVNGVSSRFDRGAPEYQAWLGGYVVKLSSRKAWSVKDHFQLAIADQNSWLCTYGDPHPLTTTKGCEFKELGVIQSGRHKGTLYEGGCITHSDMGSKMNSTEFEVETDVMADLFNLSNPALDMQGAMLRPQATDNPYETLTLRVYIAIFDVEPDTKVVLYGNGVINQNTDTFSLLKEDLLRAMQSCEIVKA